MKPSRDPPLTSMRRVNSGAHEASHSGKRRQPKPDRIQRSAGGGERERQRRMKQARHAN